MLNHTYNFIHEKNNWKKKIIILACPLSLSLVHFLLASLFYSSKWYENQFFKISYICWYMTFQDHPSDSLRHCIPYNNYKNILSKKFHTFYCVLHNFLCWCHKQGRHALWKNLCITNILGTKTIFSQKRCAFSWNLYFLK